MHPGTKKGYTTLLKNIHLPRYTRLLSLRRTLKYASFLESSRALHMDVLEHRGKVGFFNNPYTTVRL
jgi:hypothetical protein